MILAPGPMDTWLMGIACKHNGFPACCCSEFFWKVRFFLVIDEGWFVCCQVNTNLSIGKVFEMPHRGHCFHFED